MQTTPIIGLTTYGRHDEDKIPNHFAMPVEYVDAIRRAGGLPLLIPPGEPHLTQILDLVDGVVLTGGGDIDPQHYNGEYHATIYRVDYERDETEMALTRAVIQRKIPTLCICRGMQLLNVVLGGTLIEHIPDVVDGSIIHSDTPNLITHPIQVTDQSHLSQAMQTTQVETVSWHHQAIRQVADGLRVVAKAPDGIIEAVEMPAHPWLVGVQWHPELSAERDATQQNLFNTFIKQTAG